MNKLDKQNQDCLKILNSTEYPEKAGMLMATARHLRRSLKQTQHALKTGDNVDWALLNAKIDLDFSEYLEVVHQADEQLPDDNDLPDITDVHKAHYDLTGGRRSEDVIAELRQAIDLDFSEYLEEGQRIYQDHVKDNDYATNPAFSEERKINNYVDQRSTTDGRIKNLDTGAVDYPTNRSVHDDDWHDDLGGNGILE